MTRPKSGKAKGIDRAAELVRDANKRVHETAQTRDTPAGIARWHAALADMDAAMRHLYPPSLEQDIERIRQQDQVAIETAIAFLEADPWAFGTGYTKETILGQLRHVTFSGDQAARLRAVILARVDGPQRREFRRYCLLAPRVVDDEFREALLARLRARASGPARKALWVLDAIGDPLEPDDRVAARDIIEQIAASPQSWRAFNWLPQAVRRHRDSAWIEGLFVRAAIAGRDGEIAQYLIGAAAIRPTREQRELLTSIVLDRVRAMIEVSGSIVELADGPALREGLLALDRDIREHGGSREQIRRMIGVITRRSGGRWPGDAL